MSEPETSSVSLPGKQPALTVLSRLAQRQPRAQEWLACALNGRLTELAEVAIEVAVETGGPIGRVLADLVKDQAGPRLTERLVLRCEERDFRESVPLREVAETVTRRHLILLYGSLSLPPGADQLLQLARTLSNLGSRLARLGDWQEALSAITGKPLRSGESCSQPMPWRRSCWTWRSA